MNFDISKFSALWVLLADEKRQYIEKLTWMGNIAIDVISKIV